ncbi:hypothetical protein RIF29_06265 [Crotalaria pallida]|uniref:Uncharacterized protein n=1 Tax=Crotalaria pallida TaxID=3830 RepID=A0AAN9J5L9_CROPI
MQRILRQTKMKTLTSPLLECHNVNSDIVLESSSSKNLRVQDLSPVKFSSPDPDFIDDDLDDDLDPAWKEKVDREVMDFERILNMTLSERLRSFDHDSRPVSCLVKGDGSTHSNTLSLGWGSGLEGEPRHNGKVACLETLRQYRKHGLGL